MQLDTNVLIRHLTGEPTDQARRASAFLATAQRLELPDLIVAEMVYVLQSLYARPRREVAVQVRSVLAYPPVRVDNEERLLRALELYEVGHVDFAEAHLAARAEVSDGRVASFDRGLDRVETITRVEP